MESFTIAEANINDFNSVKNLMLKALQTDPTAFSSDHSDYANNSDSWWQNYLYGYLNQFYSKLFLAKQDNKVIGMVGILLDSKNRRKHVASVVWFYIDPEYRKFGLGRELLTNLIEFAKTNKAIKKLTLLVNAPQHKAIAIYKEFGFSISGTLQKELLINNEFIDEYIMELFL